MVLANNTKSHANTLRVRRALAVINTTVNFGYLNEKLESSTQN